MGSTTAPQMVALLRRNLALEADLTLARTELEALVGGPVEVLRGALGALEPGQPGETGPLVVARAARRPEGAIALAVPPGGPGPRRTAMLRVVIRRAAFLQALLIRLESRAAEDALLTELREVCGPVVTRISLADGGSALLAIPHFGLIELGSLISAKAASTAAVAGDLEAALAALLGSGSARGERQTRVANNVISRTSPTVVA